MSVNELSGAVEALNRDGSSSMVASTHIRQHWQQVTDDLLDQISKLDVSKGLADEMDKIVRTLSITLCSEKITFIATGGYGRGRLAPQSDIDLLVLIPEGVSDDSLLPFLHTFWDAQLPLSQMTHTVNTAITAATEDAVTRTAFLDARYIAGNRAQFDDFQDKFHFLRKRTVASFVEEKLSEQKERHMRRGRGFEIEPDIKEGRGGLRDLDTLHWIDRYISGDKAEPRSMVVDDDLFTERERRRLEMVVSFFWTVRIHLHDLTGRADERLYFGLQKRLAERLGFTDRGDASAVERFMRYYFLNAKEVVRLTTTALQTLRRQAQKSDTSATMTRMMDRVMQDYPFDDESNLVRRGGLLTFMDHRRAEETPRDLFVLLRAAGRYHVEIAPDALKTLARGARQVVPHEDQDPDVHAVFLDILREVPDLESVLHTMVDTGLLGRYLPGFGGAIGKIEYGLFRQYTLDEHILMSVGILSDILNDRDDGRFKLTKPLAKSIDDPAPMYLTLLLQETELGLQDPTPEDIYNRVMENIAHILPDEEDARLIAYTVAHRDLLFNAVARRNINDVDVIEKISEEIPSGKHLAFLAVITSCIHRTAGHGSWEEYSKGDIRVLVKSLQAFQVGGTEAIADQLESRRRALQFETQSLLGPSFELDFQRFLDRTETSFWSLADVSVAADLTRLVASVDKADQSGGAVVMHHVRQGLQIICYFEDRPRMFAECAGVVANVGASIYTASAFSLAPSVPGGPKMAALVLHIGARGAASIPLDTTPRAQAELQQRFCDVAKGKSAPVRLPAPLIGDRRNVFDVTPVVNIDADISTEDLVVEIEGLDRTGLLYDLATAFAEMDVSIHLALISTYGHRGMDTFYLQTSDGEKLSDPKKIAQLEATILDILDKE